MRTERATLRIFPATIWSVHYRKCTVTKFNFCHKIKTFRIQELLLIELIKVTHFRRCFRRRFGHETLEFWFGFEKFVKLNFMTPYCKVMNKRSHAALKSAFILYVYTSETYLTFYPFEDFQY